MRHIYKMMTMAPLCYKWPIVPYDDNGTSMFYVAHYAIHCHILRTSFSPYCILFQIYLDTVNWILNSAFLNTF